MVSSVYIAVLTFVHYPVVLSILSGWAVGARVDWTAFQDWKSWHDAATYDWSVATWRWFQGAVISLFLYLGIAGLANLGGVQ